MKHGFREFLRDAAKSDPDSIQGINLKEQATKLLRKDAKARKLARKKVKNARKGNR